jgi:PD-(D/E)XK nuclease superfamily
MSLPGPSSLGRIAACITSEALSHSRSSSIWAEAGDAVHAFLADCVNLGRAEALALALPEYREGLEAIPLDRLPPLEPQAYAAEVSYAFNLVTGEARELGRGLGRDEARALAKDGEMVGTADLVGLTADSVIVYDWKSGRGHVDRAEVNWQAKTYAVMAAKTHDKRAAIVFLTRVLDDGTVWHDGAQMDSMDLDVHEGAVRSLMDRRAWVQTVPVDERPPLHEGLHCKYCPALPFCPAKVSLLQATLENDGSLLQASTVELTPERATRAWNKIEAAEKLLERLKAIVKDYARHHPFRTREGYVVDERQETREEIVGVKAKPVLEAAFGDMGAVVYGESAVQTVDITKEAFKKALRKYVLPTRAGAKISHLEVEAFDALRKGGALSVRTFKSVKERKERTPGEEG